jgi:uncharacterized protein (TIGR02145 family)
MKKLITLFLILFASYSYGQIMMNIYQTSGATVSIPVNTIDSITYTGTPLPLQITTNSISSATPTTAYAEGEIIDDGGSPVTQHGFCYSYSPNPDFTSTLGLDTILIAGIPVEFPIIGVILLGSGGIGTFGTHLTYKPDSTVYVRAFAINNSALDTTYGNELVFTAPTTLYTAGAGVSDIDGNNYATAIVGSQEWMTENLRTTRYANGDAIPNITDGTMWMNATSGAWSHYDNDPLNENPYGKLYNWYAVDDVRNVCPTGWHAPSIDEWLLFADTTAGGLAVVGPKLRSTTFWDPGYLATNESGFNAVPSGFRDGTNFIGQVSLIWSQRADWWTATENGVDPTQAELLETDGSEEYGEILTYPKSIGMAVRCVKD